MFHKSLIIATAVLAINAQAGFEADCDDIQLIQADAQGFSKTIRAAVDLDLGPDGSRLQSLPAVAGKTSLTIVDAISNDGVVYDLKQKQLKLAKVVFIEKDQYNVPVYAVKLEMSKPLAKQFNRGVTTVYTFCTEQTVEEGPIGP